LKNEDLDTKPEQNRRTFLDVPVALAKQQRIGLGLEIEPAVRVLWPPSSDRKRIHDSRRLQLFLPLTYRINRLDRPQ
jgi:hypothetical protein